MKNKIVFRVYSKKKKKINLDFEVNDILNKLKIKLGINRAEILIKFIEFVLNKEKKYIIKKRKIRGVKC